MKKVTLYLVLIVITLLILFLGTKGYSYAKYAVTSTWNYFIESKGFYFSSDDINSKDNINNNWDGMSTYFNIKNSINGSLVTPYDINYTAKCTIVGGNENVVCKMNGTDSNTYSGVLSAVEACTNEDKILNGSYDESSCIDAGYSWKYVVSTKDLYFDVISTNNEEITGVRVNIEVKSTSPFKKTLTSDFILNKGITEIGSLDLKYTSFDTYDRVIVSNMYNENKCVKLSWNSEVLRIDYDQNNVELYNEDSNGYINGILFRVQSRNDKSFTFYKTNFNDTIDRTAFSLVESNECS